MFNFVVHFFSKSMISSSVPIQVASFAGEKQAITNYCKFLEYAYKSAVYEGLAAGVGIGVVVFVVFGSYSMAVYIGAKFILTKGYTGGKVMNILVAVLTSSM